jgi:curved DNA-binding protein CbpA
MAPNADPWRTLGLSPGSTQDEIRRAYRRLAKVNHPDAAGDAALPRFLAIQAAYEQLAGPDRIRRVGARPPSRPADPGTADPREPWRADPNRARASGRADGRRTPGARPSGPGARARPPGASSRPPGASEAGSGSATEGDAGAGGARRRPAAPGGGAGERQGSTGEPAAGGASPGSDRARRSSTGRRPQSRATPGSTSYEGADKEPFEPGWSGATWYGASSGTYWTINPKEYADPRKHGPEYQARARRARDDSVLDDPASGGEAGEAGAAAADETRGSPPSEGPQWPDDTTPPADRPVDDDAADGSDSRPPRPFATERARRRPGGRRHWPDGQPAMATSASEAADDPVGSSPQQGRTPGDSGTGVPPAGGLRTWIDQPADDAGFRGPLLRRPTTPAGRLAMAVLGWPPLGVFAAATIDQTTGCGTFAASCPEVSSPGTWILQAAILLLLLALPAVAAWSAHGAIATLVVGVPTAVVLSAAGGSNVREASGPLLLAVLAVAYLAGVAYAVLVPRLRSSPA